MHDALTTEVSDSVLERLLPSLDLDLAVAIARDDPVARRRLALWLREPRGARQGGAAEVAWLHGRLDDEDPEVVRAAALALGARGDPRALPVLMAELERLPSATFGTYGECLFVHPVLVKLAGGLPQGVPPVDDALDEWGRDEQGRRLRLRPELLEAWRCWWATRREAGPPP